MGLAPQFTSNRDSGLDWEAPPGHTRDVKAPLWLRRGAGFSVAAIALSSMALGPDSHNVAFAAPAACATSSTAPTYISADGNFEISTAEQLIYLSQNYEDPTGVSGVTGDWREQDYVLTASIDLGGCNFRPIGDLDDLNPNQFTGSLDGQLNTIAGLVSEQSDYSGLFGVLDGANISRLNFEDVRISTTGAYAGALGAIAYRSRISQIKVSGSVTSEAYASGGIIGGLELSSGSNGLYFSTSTASVTQSSISSGAGGLLGFSNSSVVSNSYARGSVTGVTRLGGVMSSLQSSTISNAFSTGLISRSSGSSSYVGGFNGITFSTNTVEDSFWDVDTSGRVRGSEATGKTTADMTSFSTFDDAGWSIVEGWQAFDPGSAVWGICSGVNDGYPFLLWEYDSDPCPVAESGSSSVSSESSDLERSDVVAIHFDAMVRLGTPAANHSVLIEGQGLSNGAGFQLTLSPGNRVIATGSASRLGFFSEEPSLPADLADGSYTLTLSTVAPDGSPLLLKDSFDVKDGLFASFTAVERGLGEAVMPGSEPAFPESESTPQDTLQEETETAEEVVDAEVAPRSDDAEPSPSSTPLPVWPIVWIGLSAVALATAATLWLRRLSGLGPS